MNTADRSETPEKETASPAGALGSGELYCENCGKETPHRLLRAKRSSGASPTSVSGVARCRICRWTHPFSSTSERSVEAAVIVSQGARSERRRVPLPRRLTVAVGTRISDRGVALRITRIEQRGGRSVETSPAPEIATLWAVEGDETVVPVSVVEGPRTSARVLRLSPSSRLEVGAKLEIEGEAILIVGVRARGRTWRVIGDAFAATEVQRVYGRRMLRPPAGRRDWSNEREIPRSRASSTSFSARSRSSPGVRRTATLPRAAIATGGAATHRSSPS